VAFTLLEKSEKWLRFNPGLFSIVITHNPIAEIQRELSKRGVEVPYKRISSLGSG